LSTALEQNELNEVQRMAHQLKSACEQVGIIHLSEALQTLELRAQLRQKDAVQSEAQQLLIMLERIKTELSKSAD
jgi:HPt (histidine-containing phosphotransfer) domain-containing protein